MASSMCKLTVYKVYQEVIEDVINNVRDAFLEDGVDEQVLQELKQIWETKLLATKAVDNQVEVDSKLAVARKIVGDMANGTSNGFPKAQQPQTVLKQVVGQVPPNNHVQTPVAQVVDSKLVPIQITLPARLGGADLTSRVLTIHVPPTILQENQLQRILTGPVISATMSLPHALASSMLQQHVNASISGQQQAQQQQVQVVQQPQAVVQQLAAQQLPTQQITTQQLQTQLQPHQLPTQPQQATQNLISVANSVTSVTQNDGADDSSEEEMDLTVSASNSEPQFLISLPISNKLKSKKVKQKYKSSSKFLEILLSEQQLDGVRDTSDDDDDGSEDDEASDDVDDDKDEDEQEMDEGGPEEEPLNSEDDVTDEDPAEVFDTENVIVCQYDKITRSRNKWKFHLKDGIMNLDGDDYVFQKANGDAEW